MHMKCLMSTFDRFKISYYFINECNCKGCIINNKFLFALLYLFLAPLRQISPMSAPTSSEARTGYCCILDTVSLPQALKSRSLRLLSAS